MNNIYVHHNPGNIPYNAYMLIFVRSWYMPPNIDGGEPYDDSWLKVAALKSIGPGGRANYTASNANVSLIGLVHVAYDTGIVTKLSRTKPNKKLDDKLLENIKAQAIDIPAWEQSHQLSWDYNAMVRKELVQERYTARYGNDNGPYFSVASTNTSYMSLRKQVGPKPCNCGKKRR